MKECTGERGEKSIPTEEAEERVEQCVLHIENRSFGCAQVLADDELDSLRWVRLGQFQLQDAPTVPRGPRGLGFSAVYGSGALRPCQLAIQTWQNAGTELCFQLGGGFLLDEAQEACGFVEAIELLQNPDRTNARLGMVAALVNVERLEEIVILLVELRDGKEEFGALGFDPGGTVYREGRWDAGEYLIERRFSVQELATAIDGVKLLDLPACLKGSG